MKQPRYLGDGVYAKMVRGDLRGTGRSRKSSLVLTTGNLSPGENRIVIDRSVWGALCRYMEPEAGWPAVLPAPQYSQPEEAEPAGEE